jgi:integrase
MAPTRRTAFLTDDFVRDLQPPTDADQIIVWDAPDPAIPGTAGTYVPGLGIRVTRTGIKAFIMNYLTHDAVQRRPKIGRWPQWKTDKARRRAIEWRAVVDNGGDPRGERLTKRAAAEEKREREAAEMSVRQLVDKFLAEYVTTKRARTAQGYASTLRVHVLCKPIADMRVTAVTDVDTSALHLEITRSGRRTQANRVLSVLSKMFKFAETCGLRPKGSNPARGITRNREVQMNRYLSAEELDRIRAALDVHPMQDSANAIRMLVYTGCRRGEALSMQWDHVELNAEHPEWRRPAHLQKTGKPHTVPLAPQAAELLLGIRNGQIAAGIYRDAGFIFPSGTAKVGHLVSINKTWTQVLAHAGIKQRTRLHDLRHGFASMLVSAGYSLPVIGEMLAHVSPQTTKRYAHLDKRVKQEAAAAVADIFSGKRRA